jgi:signal transduction histidine kinase
MTEPTGAIPQAEDRFEFWRRSVGHLLAPVAFLALWFLSIAGWSEGAHRLPAVFGLVITLWITEAIPLAVTAFIGSQSASHLLATFANAVAFSPSGSRWSGGEPLQRLACEMFEFPCAKSQCLATIQRRDRTRMNSFYSSRHPTVLCPMFGLCLGLFALWPFAAGGVPVSIRAVESSAPLLEGFPIEAAVDGVLTPDNGWSIGAGVFQEQFAVFAPEKPLIAALFQFQFSFLSATTNAHFGDFEVDVTTDEHPAVNGRWTALIPELAVANCSGGVRTFGSAIRIETQCAVSRVTVRARAPFAGITGFLVKLLPTTNDFAGKRPPAIGCSPEGTFVLTEFRVEIDPQRTGNLAKRRQLYCSRDVAPGLPSANLTDSFFSTYSHPNPQSDGSGDFFELDLGRMIPLDHITLRGREDGPETDQLAAYRVELLNESGDVAGETQWQSRPAARDARLPIGTADVVRAGNGAGTFAGRRIRIHNESAQNNQPLIAELEVYPALFPRPQNWLADGRALEAGSEVAVPAGVRRLQFTMGCGEFGNFQDRLVYRWRISGWRDEWQEAGADERVVISPAPSAGLFKLELQVKHSDGIWDESGVPVALRIPLPWWRNMPLVTTVIFMGLALALAAGWRVKTTVMKRQLALAEQHLDLHRERLRIARDMHDEMGARLTYIALLADRTLHEATVATDEHLLADLTDLAESARSSVNALDAIVWAVSPQHDTVGDLADYLSNYAPTFVKAADIECRLDLHMETPRHSLGLRLRHPLLMAVKEALQNVVRHSGATTVRLGLRQTVDRLEISVTDDGRGLCEPAAGVSHRGLDNMRQRLAEAGGVCEINPGGGGRGTRVRFIVPLRQPK